MFDRDIKQNIPKGDGNFVPTLDTQYNQMRRKLLTLGGFISLALFVAGCNSKTRSKHRNIPSRRKLVSDRSKENFYEQRNDLWKASGDDFHKDGGVDLQENEHLSRVGWKKRNEMKITGEKNGAELGYSVTMSANGNRVAVGCPKDGDNREGSVLAFDYGKGPAGKTIKGDQRNESTGSSILLSENSKWMVIGEPNTKSNGKKNAGRVRIFNLGGVDWKQVGNDIKGKETNEKCGGTVSISNNGQRVVVGCTGNKTSRIYDLKGEWEQVGDDIDAGGTVSMTRDGKIVAVSDSNKNRVEIYEFKKNGWTQMGNTLSENDGYGYAISIAKQRDVVRLAVGAESKSDVRTYEYDPSGKKWKEMGKVTSIKGRAVHLTPTNYLAVGDPTNNNNKGVVKVFRFDGNTWKQQGGDINGIGSSQTGFSVDLDYHGTVLFVGSPGAKNKKGKAQVYRYK